MSNELKEFVISNIQKELDRRDNLLSQIQTIQEVSSRPTIPKPVRRVLENTSYRIQILKERISYTLNENSEIIPAQLYSYLIEQHLEINNISWNPVTTSKTSAINNPIMNHTTARKEITKVHQNQLISSSNELRSEEIFKRSPKASVPCFPKIRLVNNTDPFIVEPQVYRPITGFQSDILVQDGSRHYPLVFGKSGSNMGELNHPWGIAVTNKNEILITDRINHRVQIFDRHGTAVHSFGKPGIGPGEFNRPCGIDIDPYGRIVVVDKDNHRVQIFSYDYKFIRRFGSRGKGLGQFDYPWDVACSFNRIAVSDTKNKRVQIFDETGKCIQFLLGSEHRPFQSPRGVSWSPFGALLVTDFSQNLVYIFYNCCKEDKSQRSICIFTHPGTNYEFQRPQGIIADSYNNILVADSKNQRIQVFNMLGEFQFALGGFRGTGIGQFAKPSDIALTCEGRVVIVDQNNDRIQIF